MKVTVVTVTNRIPTEPYYRFEAWKKSITRFGVEPVVLGMGETWHGLVSKPRHLLKWLQSAVAKDTDCLIFTDSWDVLFLRHPDDVATEWVNVGMPWICGAERNLFPPDDEKPWPQCGTPYRFLNSGAIISTVPEMIAVLEAMNPDVLPNDHELPDGSAFHSNDQKWLQDIFLKQPIPMRLDSECRFIWNLCDVPAEDLGEHDGMFFNKKTGTCPMIAHANGGAKEGPIFLEMLKQLGL